MNVFMPTAPAPQPQSTPQSQAATPPGQTSGPSGTVPPEAVKPAQQTQAENKSRNSTAFAGKGAGAGSQDVLAPRAMPDDRPQDAAPVSILNAKVADQSPQPIAGMQEDQPPPPSPSEQMDARSDDTPDRPPVKLPDPLPTSPFLKPAWV